MLFLFNQNRKQIKAIFDWLSEIVNQDDLILVEYKNKQKGYFFEFPLRIGDRPKKLKETEKKEFTFFIRFFPSQSKVDEKEWKLLFQSPEMAVYENKRSFKGEQFYPMRWGLNEEEKKAALKIARESLRIFLEEKRTLKTKDLNLPSKFDLKADLDVALWVNGIIRGSAVVENITLREGIVQAATLVSRDTRFKPLELDELKNARIEITLFSDLKMPLSQESIKRNKILYDKGYLLKRGEKQGWFLPEVFNVISFKDLKEFLSHLALKKASLRPEEVLDRKTEVFIFEVDDFIDGEEIGEVLSLAGPMAKIDKTEMEIKKFTIAAADWLLKKQEPDGNFIPIANPITGKISQIDWPRSIFTGWSLVEFGKVTGSEKYVEAGRRNFSYGRKYILDESIIKNPNSESLILAYLGQGALSLSHKEEAKQCGYKILEKENLLKFEPILFSQIGSFLAEFSKMDKTFLAPALKFGAKTQVIFSKFISRKRITNLAVWAELVNLQLKLWEVDEDDSRLSAVRKIIEWLLSYQLKDGSFRATSDNYSGFAYTRGTAKIAEVLAAMLLWEKQNNGKIDKVSSVNYHEDCLKKTLSWLSEMQYSSNNSYFIPTKNRDLALGGFRHDYFNQEVWIDSAGHFLLSVSRYLKYLN